MERFMEAIQVTIRDVGTQFIRAIADLHQREDETEDNLE